MVGDCPAAAQRGQRGARGAACCHAGREAPAENGPPAVGTAGRPALPAQNIRRPPSCPGRRWAWHRGLAGPQLPHSCCSLGNAFAPAHWEGSVPVQLFAASPLRSEQRDATSSSMVQSQSPEAAITEMRAGADGQQLPLPAVPGAATTVVGQHRPQWLAVQQPHMTCSRGNMPSPQLSGRVSIIWLCPSSLRRAAWAACKGGSMRGRAYGAGGCCAVLRCAVRQGSRAGACPTLRTTRAVTEQPYAAGQALRGAHTMPQQAVAAPGQPAGGALTAA